MVSEHYQCCFATITQIAMGERYTPMAVVFRHHQRLIHHVRVHHDITVDSLVDPRIIHEATRAMVETMAKALIAECSQRPVSDAPWRVAVDVAMDVAMDVAVGYSLLRNQLKVVEFVVADERMDATT